MATGVAAGAGLANSAGPVTAKRALGPSGHETPAAAGFAGGSHTRACEAMGPVDGTDLHADGTGGISAVQLRATWLPCIGVRAFWTSLWVVKMPLQARPLPLPFPRGTTSEEQSLGWVWLDSVWHPQNRT